MKKSIVFGLRVLCTAALLTLAFQKVDAGQLWNALDNVRWSQVLLAATALCIMRALMSARLRLVSAKLGYRIRFYDVFRMVMTSSLAAYVLPGGIATDVALGYQLRLRLGSTRAAVATVSIDRYFGVASILLIGAVAGMAFRETFQEYFAYVFTLPLIFVLLLPFIGSKTAKWIPKKPALLGKAGDLMNEIADEIRPSIIFAKVFALSTLIHLFRCSVFVFLFIAFDIAIDPFYAFIFVPVLFVSIMLPISLGGLGLREGILVFLFVPLGASPEALVLAGLMAHFLELVTLAPGFWYVLTERMQRPQGRVT